MSDLEILFESPKTTQQRLKFRETNRLAAMKKIIQKLTADPEARFFLQPVDVVKDEAAHYYEKISSPMD